MGGASGTTATGSARQTAIRRAPPARASAAAGGRSENGKAPARERAAAPKRQPRKRLHKNVIVYAVDGR